MQLLIMVKGHQQETVQVIILKTDTLFVLAEQTH